MDPTVCFTQMQSALEAGDTDDAIEQARNLRKWLDRGGFPPVGVPVNEVENWLTRVLAMESETEP